MRNPAILLFSILLTLTCVMFAQQADGDDSDRKVRFLQESANLQDEPEKTIAAIEGLGSSRTTRPDAIRALVGALGFKRIYPWEVVKREPGMINEIRPITRFGRYPAMTALIQIGEPAIPFLLEAIKNRPSDSLISDNALRVFHLYFRDEPNEARRILLESEASTSSQSEKTRLGAARKRFEELMAGLG